MTTKAQEYLTSITPDRSQGADKEVVELHKAVHVRVGVLLVPQHDVRANAQPSGLFRPTVGGFHDARAATGHNGVPCLGQASSQLACQRVEPVVLGKPRGAKNRDARHGDFEELEPL
jgi:hypothetical protein